MIILDFLNFEVRKLDFFTYAVLSSLEFTSHFHFVTMNGGGFLEQNQHDAGKFGKLTVDLA